MSQQAEKIIILGIDGGTWDVLGPACERGWMPRLQKIREQGCWGQLDTVHPPITPAAWASFMTGTTPGKHGVLGFLHYERDTDNVHISTSRSIRQETVWEKLSRHGKRVIVSAVPMTYPPIEVNGYLVSGFDTPSTESEFTYPPELKEEILREIPDYTYARKFLSNEVETPEQFGAYLDWLKRQSDQQVILLKMLMAKGGWDVAMTMLRSFDELLHPCWGLLDFDCDTAKDPRHGMMERYFRELDAVITDVTALAEEHQASLLMMSDHGGQLKRGSLYPNGALVELGDLRLHHNLWKKIGEKLAKKIRRRGRRDHPLGKRMEKQSLNELIDFKRSRAYITEVNIYASLYVLVKGKHPRGIVEPDEVEPLIDSLIETLRDYRGEDGKVLFEMVERPQKLYGLSQPDDSLPDLLLAPRDGYVMRQKLKGKRVLKYEKSGSLEGTHSMRGMFAALGAGIHSGKEVRGDIIDITPTLLAMMGLPISDDIDGKVLSDIFVTAPTLQSENATGKKEATAKNLSQDDEDEISSRLADLGYM